LGRYLTAETIARRNPYNVSDLFRNVPGLTLETEPGGIDKRIRMRGAFGECEPVTYINGMYMAALTSRDIDTWVRPEEVAGIEVYSETTIPAQFRRSMRDCGALVIWTKS
jgi:outer membrane receptor for ferrienterochelin and colicin